MTGCMSAELRHMEQRNTKKAHKQSTVAKMKDIYTKIIKEQ